MHFSYNLPVNLLFGCGTVLEAGKKAALYGRKALVVTGRSAKKSGILDKTLDLLDGASVESAVFDRVEPNPTTVMASEGAAFFKEKGCDMVLGIGGGSILDAAKAIAFLSRNDGDIMDYIYGRAVPGDAAPIVLIPTTCGTGSEGNGFSVLTDPKTGDKKSLRCNSIIAGCSIIDPDLMMTLPEPMLATVGFDALCHCMEAFISSIATPLSSLMALEGIRLIHESLLPLYRRKGGKAEWEKLAWASTLGGMCIGSAGVTAPHGMEHPPSGLRNITHGRGLAALTPAIFARSIKSASAEALAKFAAISRCLGGKDQNDCVEVIKELLAALDLTVTLGGEGIKKEDIDWMAENTLKVSAAGIANHPVQFSLEEIKAIYHEVW